ncbi:energy transducer TonB [Salmonirosea aquatica]|uniref:TonB C-terminal domain-containing protein n=1 Tax=Salmonirosea aquatica TaxID=2654236 RepID=A0A7C9BFH0_9BACT|nr:hypothetical protein [Cytophagaceae bacterium SJW1-29]
MKYLLLPIFIILFAEEAEATGKASDKLVKDGDTLTLLTKPLDKLLFVDSLWYKTDKKPEFSRVIDCWTGYTAIWTLEGRELFLTAIESCTRTDEHFQADLSVLFGSQVKNGKVRADWVSGELVIPVGKLLRYFETPSMSYYEGERVLTMQDGLLVKEERFDNSKTYQSKFTKSAKLFYEYIYSHIDWSRIPNLGDKKVKVFLKVTAGSDRRPDSVAFMKKSNYYSIDQEAMRAVKSLPEWDVYYRRGKPYPVPWSLPILFDETTRKKYAF